MCKQARPVESTDFTEAAAAEECTSNGGALPAAPGPQDIHPNAYASAAIPPSGLYGLLTGLGQLSFQSGSRGPAGDPSTSLLLPLQVESPPRLNQKIYKFPWPYTCIP